MCSELGKGMKFDVYFFVYELVEKLKELELCLFILYGYGEGILVIDDE